MTLLAIVITDIGANSTLPSIKLVTCVALDIFGLLVGLTVVTLPVTLPFLTLPLEIPLLFVVIFVRVLGLLVSVLTLNGSCLWLGLRLSRW